MDASIVTKLMALLEQFPEIKTKLMGLTNIEDGVTLLKSKGLDIAKSELQEFIAKKLAGNAAKDVIGKLAGNGGAGDLLKGILGK